jgi:Na+(H+)/acetate symporter ActP
VYLWTLPMFHCNGWCFPWTVCAVVGTHVCLRAVRGPLMWQLMAEHGVSHMCGAPVVMATLLETPAAQRPAAILYLVAASFSLAGAGLVPAMVLGIFWRRTSRVGAVSGMLVGLGVTLYYMGSNFPPIKGALGSGGLWWGIQPVSAGVFGVPAGLLATFLGSLAWPKHAIDPQVPT